MAVRAKLKLLNFEKVKDKLNPDRFSRAMKRHVRIATQAIAVRAEAEIKMEMGKAGVYAENAPMTIAMKGSGQPLDNTSELSKSITGVALFWHTAAIGILKSRQVRDPVTGQSHDLLSIATILHNGAIVPVSDAMRKLFFWLANSSRSPVQGEIQPLGPRTTEIVIPGREFLKPAVSTKMKLEAKRRWGHAVQAAISNWRY